jgi:hypothetical protein
MAKDWRSGTLVGSGYAIMAQGKAQITARDKETLRKVWAATGSTVELPEHFIKQVCFVLPPWEATPPAPSDREET